MTNIDTTTTTTTNGKGKARAASRIPPDESREDKFVRLAMARVGALKAKIRQIKNLARYPHTEEQGRKIVTELKKMAADIETAFAPRANDDTFSF